MKSLLKDMKKASLKAAVTRSIVFIAIAAVFFGVAVHFGALKTFEPGLFWDYSEDIIDGEHDMVGEFVELEVDYILDYYIQEYSQSHNTHTNTYSSKTITSQYYLFPVDEDFSYFFTIIAGPKYFDELEQICEETWEALQNGEEPETTLKVQGVFVNLVPEDYRLAASYFSQAFGEDVLISDVGQYMSPVALKVDYMSEEHHISARNAFLVIAAVCLAIAILMWIPYFTGYYLSCVRKLTNGYDESMMGIVQADYNAATQYGKNVYVGNRFVFGPASGRYAVVPFEDILWIYQYKQTTKGGSYHYLQVNTKNKKVNYKIGPLKNADMAVQMIKHICSSIPMKYVGASADYFQVHKREFDRMLQETEALRRQAQAEFNPPQYDNTQQF